MLNENYWMSLSRRPPSRRRLLVAAASAGSSAVGAALLGCSRQSPATAPRADAGRPVTRAAQATPQSGGTFNGYALSNYPLDPQKVSGTGHQVVSGGYSRVFRYQTAPDPKVFTDHELESDAGISAESPDATTWTVKLRTDVKFQNTPPINGHTLEAEDVQASFVRALDPATGNPNRAALNMVDVSQIQTPARDTIVFKLRYPYAPFKKTLASADASWILPREALTGSFDPSKQVIGSGPFILSGFTPDVAYTYNKNPDWFERGRPYVDGMRIAVVPDPGQQLAQFAAANIDELVLDNIDDATTANQRVPKATTIAVPGTSYPVYVQLGDPASVFQDIRVRWALSMALDRDALNKAIYKGQGIRPLFVPAYMGKWSLKVEDLDPSAARYYTHDPAETKKLLEAAAATNLQLKFAYATGGGFTPLTAKLAEAISNMFNAAGIKTNLVAIDYNKDLVDAGKGFYQGYFDKDTILFGGTAGYDEADQWLFSYFDSKSTPAGAFAGHLQDSTLDAMVDKQRTLVDEGERLNAVKDIERYIAGKMYVIPSIGGLRYAVVQPRLQNYSYTMGAGKWTETYAKLWLKE